MKIYVDHWRYDEKGNLFLTSTAKRRKVSLSPRGGITTVSVIDNDGNEIAYAGAQCSMMDNYSKKIGRMIAIGRALKQLGYDKETRKRTASQGAPITL